MDYSSSSSLAEIWLQIYDDSFLNDESLYNDHPTTLYRQNAYNFDITSNIISFTMEHIWNTMLKHNNNTYAVKNNECYPTIERQNAISSFNIHKIMAHNS